MIYITLLPVRQKSILKNMRNEKKIQNAIKNVTVHGWGIIELRNCGLTEIPEVLYNYPDLVSIDISNTEYVSCLLYTSPSPRDRG